MQKKYHIIYADPPWKHRKCLFSQHGNTRSPERHYPTMPLEEIKQLQVGSIAEKDCILFLWVTFPKLKEAFSVIEAWGFCYQTVAFVWIKQNKKSPTYFFGLGYWTRANAEICLLATKGKPKRNSNKVSQLIISPIQEHSKKPAITRDKIIKVAGDLPKIELFARQKVEGWDAWGNEIESDISL